MADTDSCFNHHHGFSANIESNGFHWMHYSGRFFKAEGEGRFSQLSNKRYFQDCGKHR